MISKNALLITTLLTAPFINVAMASDAVENRDALNHIELKKVTLFLQGAELQGQTTAIVPKGESTILLTNLANNININSINVSVGDQATILSTTLVNDYLSSKNDDDEINTLKQSIKSLNSEKDNLIIKLKVTEEELALLQQNRIETLTNNSGSLNDKKQAIDFIIENLAQSLTEQQRLTSLLSELDERIAQYQAQLASKQNGQNKYSNLIKVKVYAPEAMTLPITLSYVSQDAGWTPNYDVRVKDINSPVVLTYKANIYQYTGLSWHNVDFTLSTANPSEGIVAPTLTPWNINVYDDKSKFAYRALKESAPVMSSDVSYELLKNEGQSLKLRQNDNAITDNNGIHTQFSVLLPYTITGNSKDNVITLKARIVNAKYHYVAVPKKDSNAFLQAQIDDWDKLELLPGKSTVFFADNYIGESYLTTAGIKETLDISLGRDKSIVISRNQDLNETSKPSFFGNNVSQKFAYTIDIKNTKDMPIDITIYDQAPVIQNKIITMDELKYSNAEYNKESGLLTWHLNINAKESTKLPFSFQLKYPKDKSIIINGL